MEDVRIWFLLLFSHIAQTFSPASTSCSGTNGLVLCYLVTGRDSSAIVTENRSPSITSGMSFQLQVWPKLKKEMTLNIRFWMYIKVGIIKPSVVTVTNFRDAFWKYLLHDHYDELLVRHSVCHAERDYNARMNEEWLRCNIWWYAPWSRVPSIFFTSASLPAVLHAIRL